MGGVSEATVQPPPVQEKRHPAELQALLSTMPNEREREAMTTAFYTVCEGDPKSPLVQQGLFTRGHLRTMIGHVASFQLIASALQEELHKTVDLPKLSKMLDEHEKKVAARVELMVSANRELYESQHRKAVEDLQLNESWLETMREYGLAVQKASLDAVKAARSGSWMLRACCFLAGVLFYGVVQLVFRLQ